MRKTANKDDPLAPGPADPRPRVGPGEELMFWKKELKNWSPSALRMMFSTPKTLF